MAHARRGAATAGLHFQAALSACRTSVIAITAFSLFINLLMLTTPLFMLQLFDRVLTSRSTETLLMLILIAGVALVVMSVLEVIRGVCLVRIGGWLERRLAPDAVTASLRVRLRNRAQPSSQGLRDLSTVRSILASPALYALLDAPWTPIFLALMFLLHPYMGWLSVAGAIVLFALAAVNERRSRRLIIPATTALISAQQEAELAVRNADAVEAMGMLPNFLSNWRPTYDSALRLQETAGQGGVTLTAISRLSRLFLQIGLLSLGAWLVLQNEIGPGTMIAGSILMSRALAPVELATGSWRSIVGARDAYGRLRDHLSVVPGQSDNMPVPIPQGDLSVEGVDYEYGRAEKPILNSVSFRLAAGESLGVMGPTASGKSTLARLVVGSVKPNAGHIRLDGLDVSQWDSSDRGQHVGYLPQSVQLFGGSVHRNIARLATSDPAAVVEAARLAGVHEMIMRLPQGYDTDIGPGGERLSGGQRQRIALARAVYGNPRLVVLDEPNASLDGEGEAALANAINALRQRGATVIIIAQRWGILRGVDRILVLNDGAVELFGSRQEVFARLAARRGEASQPRLTASDPAG